MRRCFLLTNLASFNELLILTSWNLFNYEKQKKTEKYLFFNFTKPILK